MQPDNKKNLKEILCLDDVILFEMQRCRTNALCFYYILQACKKAFPHLPVNAGRDMNHNEFFHDMLSAIENLENNDIAHVTRYCGRIINIFLTERGKFLKRNFVFIQQQRMGKG